MSEEPVEFNPFAPGYLENPYAQMGRLRNLDPIHATPLGAVYVSRYDDVVALLRDTSLSVDPAHVASNPIDDLYDSVVEAEGFDPPASRSMLDKDPPDHTRLRRLVSKAFTPRRIAQLEPRIRELVDARLDAVAGRGGLELIGDLAFPLPFEVISDMLGMPETDRDRVRRVSGTLVRSLEPVVDPEVIRAILAAQVEIQELVSSVIEWKRDHPGDDLLTLLIEAEDDGDRLTDEELLSQVILLFVAGHETTVNLIGNGVLALVRHPEQWHRLRAEPGLLENAIEELLRFDSPVQMTRRIPRDVLRIGGRSIEPGTFVLLSLASANRDERRFGDDADRLDLGRETARDHVAFGGGTHFCLGAALARLEARIAIGSLVERVGSLSLAGEPTYNGRINLRGLDRLELRSVPA